MRLILLISIAMLFVNVAMATTPDWSDEFRYVGLPDPNKWAYEEGFVRNNELQYYTVMDREDVYVDGEHLVITANKRIYKNKFYKKLTSNWKERDGFSNFTSASIHTKNKAAWDSGIIEIRAKLPVGSGVWPAFWMLGENIDTVGYPECGEIDIMEYFGREPNKITANVHIKTLGGKKSFPGNVSMDTRLDGFNLYKLKWGGGVLDFYFNGRMFHSVVYESISDHPFLKPFYLIINFAVGGDPSGYVDESGFPKKLIVDYVRYYKDAN